MAAAHVVGPVLAAERHRHLAVEPRVDDGGDEVVVRREQTGPCRHQQREVLAVRVVVADQEVQRDRVEQGDHVAGGTVVARRTEGEAVGERRPALASYLRSRDRPSAWQKSSWWRRSTFWA